MKSSMGKIAAIASVGLLSMQLLPAVLVTTTVTSSLTAIVNKNDNDTAAGGGSGGSSCSKDNAGASSGTSQSTKEAALKVARALADAGYSKASTAGVIANLVAESGIVADKGEYGGGGGYGIAQWTPRSKIRAWLDANGMEDTPDSDFDAQVKMLVATAQSSFNNHYLLQVIAEGVDVIGNDLYTTWLKTGTPEVAAVAWMAGWERPNWALRNEDTRRQVAREYFDNELNGIEFDGHAITAGGDTGADGGSGSGSSEAVDVCSSNGSTEYGSVGGAPEDMRDYSWMCDDIGVCRDGDGLQGEGGNLRNFYTANVARYQCVWYAWNRAAMIHGSEGWHWVGGNGGQVAGVASGIDGWEVSPDPHPGDIVSQFGGALGGDGTYGHIAVVEEVVQDGDGWKLRISEGNYNTDGSGPWTGYNSRWLTSGQFSGAGNVFVRNTNWK